MDSSVILPGCFILKSLSELNNRAKISLTLLVSAGAFFIVIGYITHKNSAVINIFFKLCLRFR